MALTNYVIFKKSMYMTSISGVYYVVTAGLLWSMMGLGIRVINNADVWQILLYRSGSLVLFLYVLLLLQRKQSPFLLLYKAKAPIFFAAAGLFVAYSGGIYAIQNTTVANAMLLFASAPFITSKQLTELSQKISKGKPPGCLKLSQEWQILWDKNSIRIKNPLLIDQID